LLRIHDLPNHKNMNGMNIILFDKPNWKDLLPLTFTRPVSEIRVGILKISEKWGKYLGGEISFLTESYLQEKYKLIQSSNNLYINGAVLPNPRLVDEICSLKEGEVIKYQDNIIAFKAGELQSSIEQSTANYMEIDSKSDPFVIKYPWNIFTYNGLEIENDYKLITKGRTSQTLATTNRIIGENIFVEEGVLADFVCINAPTGYVYLGKDSEIMDGTLIKGSFSLGEHAIVKLGAKIYGPTSIGPGCRVGGEVNNSVMLGNSNKGHDGFLGNSVLGEWCNLGADTNNSNLKNNYSQVKAWNYTAESFIKTGLQFCGLIMGDHSKSGINTMFNTGTVVGVSSNIFGAGYPRNFIPSFSMGGNQGFVTYIPNKAFETADLVMKRRDMEFNDVEKRILMEVFERTKKYRSY
jgi:UDP-N-acetylglucosamine diphosphorylase/glucosamine-1-phosphate N-acetyltransferase